MAWSIFWVEFKYVKYGWFLVEHLSIHAEEGSLVHIVWHGRIGQRVRPLNPALSSGKIFFHLGESFNKIKWRQWERICGTCHTKIVHFEDEKNRFYLIEWTKKMTRTRSQLYTARYWVKTRETWFCSKNIELISLYGCFQSISKWKLCIHIVKWTKQVNFQVKPNKKIIPGKLWIGWAKFDKNRVFLQ